MKVTYQTQEYNLQKPTTVQELLKQEIESSKYKVVGCIFNNEYQNLKYEIQTDGKLELIDTFSKEGMKIYVRTLVYIMGKAFEKLYPNEKMTVEYQLGHAMFCTCDNIEITQEFMENMTQEIQKIIDQNLEIKKVTMTREEAEKAILVGIQMVQDLKEQGYGILATGEMGIGNTTTSSAVVSVLLGKPVEEMTGRGAGLNREGFNKKILTIKNAIQLHNPDSEDAIDVLSKVGGLDLAGIAGVFLGGAIYRVPILIDGFISAAGALCAARICPKTKDFMLATHVSKEPAAVMILKELGLEAPLHCDMCLGEGTGAVAFYPILDLANEVYTKMSTFEDIKVEQYEEYK